MSNTGFETAPIRGVLDTYGPRKTNSKFGGQYGTKDGYMEYVYEYDATDVPNDTSKLANVFPAGTVITQVRTIVSEAIAGLTSPTVTATIGSFTTGADALSAATAGGTAVDTTTGSVGATPAYLVVTLGGTGTATAGKLRTIITAVLPK